MQRKWLVTAIVCAGVFMASLDLFIVNIAFPSIARAYGGTSLSSLSWIVSGYSIVFAALLAPAGRWADAFGRKRAFVWGLVVFVIASVACALAPAVGWLIAARLHNPKRNSLRRPGTNAGHLSELCDEIPDRARVFRSPQVGISLATGDSLKCRTSGSSRRR